MSSLPQLTVQFEEDLTETFAKYSGKCILTSFSRLRTLESYLSGHLLDKKLIEKHHLIHQNFPIPNSITSLPHNAYKQEKFKSKALILFAKICCITGDNVYTDPSNFPLQIISTVSKDPLLKDELFAQLIKQTIKNAHKSLLVYWKLIYLFLKHLEPSNEMCDILLSHITQKAKAKGFSGFATVPDIAKNCFLVFRNKFLTSSFQNYINNRNAKKSNEKTIRNKKEAIRIWSFLCSEKSINFPLYLSDDSILRIEVLPSYSIEYVIKIACRTVGFMDYKNWFIGFRLKKTKALTFDYKEKVLRENLFFYHYTKISVLHFLSFYWSIFDKFEVRFYLYNNFIFDFKISLNSSHLNFQNRSQKIKDLKVSENSLIQTEKDFNIKRKAINKDLISQHFGNDIFLLRLIFYQWLYEFTKATKEDIFQFSPKMIKRIVGKAVFSVSTGKVLGIDEVQNLAEKFVPFYFKERLESERNKENFSSYNNNSNNNNNVSKEKKEEGKKKLIRNVIDEILEDIEILNSFSDSPKILKSKFEIDSNLNFNKEKEKGMKKSFGTFEDFILKILNYYNKIFKRYQMIDETDEDEKINFIIDIYKESLEDFVSNDYFGFTKIRCKMLIFFGIQNEYLESEIMKINNLKIVLESLDGKVILDEEVEKVEKILSRVNKVEFVIEDKHVEIESREAIKIRKILEKFVPDVE